jgi:hypothetical protein
VNSDRVDAVSDFIGKKRIDHAMTFNPPLAYEARRRHFDAEMGLTARSRARMAGVKMGLVFDLQSFGRERGLEL